MQQDDRIFQLGCHFVRVGDKIRRQVTAVKLHAFDNNCLCFQTFVFFNCDDAFIANTLHRICDLLANIGFAIGGDCAHLRNFCAVSYGT